MDIFEDINNALRGISECRTKVRPRPRVHKADNEHIEHDGASEKKLLTHILKSFFRELLYRLVDAQYLSFLTASRRFQFTSISKILVFIQNSFK